MIKASTLFQAEELVRRYPELVECRESLLSAVEAICESYREGHKLLVCGNGGSATDSDHIVGELMKGFLLPRQMEDSTYVRLKEMWPSDAEYYRKNLQGTLPAIALGSQRALSSAFANDQVADLGFAQEVFGYGEKGDVLLAITTSGNSENVVHAAKIAKLKMMRTIALTGRTGGKIKDVADISICVPEDETYRIQEYHLPIYHMLCIAAEHEFFWDSSLV